MTLTVWYTRRPDAALMFDVEQAGHACVQADTEALVRGVVAQHPQSVVLIGPDVPEPQARAIQQHFQTICVRPGATAKDLIWEVSFLERWASSR